MKHFLMLDELCLEIESAEDFASAVPEKYTAVFQQAIDEVRRLHASGKLPAVCHKKDTKKATPLLAKSLVIHRLCR